MAIYYSGNRFPAKETTESNSNCSISWSKNLSRDHFGGPWASGGPPRMEVFLREWVGREQAEMDPGAFSFQLHADRVPSPLRLGPAWGSCTEGDLSSETENRCGVVAGLAAPLTAGAHELLYSSQRVCLVNASLKNLEFLLFFR